MVGGVKEEDLLLAAVRHGDAQSCSAVGPADENAAWRDIKIVTLYQLVLSLRICFLTSGIAPGGWVGALATVHRRKLGAR